MKPKNIERSRVKFPIPLPIMIGTLVLALIEIILLIYFKGTLMIGAILSVGFFYSVAMSFYITRKKHND